MKKIERSALVRFSADAMLKLVSDVEAYPEFLPWCRSSRIISRSDQVIEAELEIAKGGFHKKFATRNRLTAKGEIEMSLITGPFRHLEGVWRFLPLRDDASKISLDLEFELSGALSSLAFGAVFNQICNSMVNAFSERAKAVYNGRSI